MSLQPLLPSISENILTYFNGFVHTCLYVQNAFPIQLCWPDCCPFLPCSVQICFLQEAAAFQIPYLRMFLFQSLSFLSTSDSHFSHSTNKTTTFINLLISQAIVIIQRQKRHLVHVYLSHFAKICKPCSIDKC